MLDKIVLSDLLNKACVITDMQANSKMDVIEQLTQSLCEQGIIDNKQGFIDDVLAREALGSTGFENQIAIPHGKSRWVKETRIAVAKLKETVDWETMDSSDVRLVILFAVKEVDSGAGHIKVLARISIALGDDDIVEKLLNANSQEELYRLIISNTRE
ncbi:MULTISPECIES: PTS sugar transporter subunit IIA [Buttiauxella]|uniref:PTS sugar transporter subunit IIA n=1 Tax=Buttiauxella TaxID=82976 RepID=UPI0010653BB0|nr:PTS sugar transporter subunit IIA [Buttiauxella sp. BIGb0552]TDX15399.1 PTS system fructose-specific IIA component [Buttiauxella sp. BIGb0552]